MSDVALPRSRSRTPYRNPNPYRDLSRNPAWTSARWYLAGPALAAGAGALLAWQPLALTGAVLLAVVARFPALAAYVILLGEGSMLLFRLALGSYAIPTAGIYACCLTALLAITVRQPDWLSLRVYLVSVAVLSPWLVYGMVADGAGQALTGLRLTTFPVLAVALGLALRPAGMRRLLSVASLVLAANAVAAGYERVVGVAGLLQRGITYGDQITEIGNDVLRAPGLMRNSFHLGLFAAAFLAVVALSTFVVEERVGRLTYPVGVPAACACLLLSTSRTSLLIVGVAGLLCVWMSDPGTRLGRISRASAAVGLPALPVAVVLLGAGSTASLGQRVGVWATLFGSKLTLLGHGLGSVGAASFSTFSSSSKVFVDNYWLSIAFQFGGLVLLAVYLGFVLLLLAVLGHRIEDPQERAIAAVLVVIAAGSILLEVWEYPAAMALLGLAVGQWWAARGRRAAGQIEEAVHAGR